MKIIYFSQPFFADCDFPLVRELQQKGHDVLYYLPITSFNKRSTLIDIKNIYPHTGIFPASIYPELNEYKDDIDLSKLYIVNQKYKQKYHPINLWLYLKLAILFWMQKPDVIHFVLQPALTLKFIYLLARKKLVMTLHDPFTHSGKENKRVEKDRLDAFKYIPKIILLNTKQKDDFSRKYNVDSSRIYSSNLGMYDSITRVVPIAHNIKKPYILFFGLITAYKGIEYLMEAMTIVHKTHPEVNLVVAGGGKMYFDITPYANLDYIRIKNKYIPMAELAGLLKDCLFVVCPYKDATQSGVVQTTFSLSVPMIVTNVGALPDSVENGKFGLVVPPCNTESLVESINKMIETPHLLDSMRKNIEKDWKERMAWGPIVEQYVECYKS